MGRKRWGFMCVVAAGFLCHAFCLGGQVPPKPRICSPNEFLVMYSDSEVADAFTAEIVARFQDVSFWIGEWVLAGGDGEKSYSGTEVVRHYVMTPGEGAELPSVVEICDDLRPMEKVEWAEPVAYGFLRDCSDDGDGVDDPEDPLYWTRNNGVEGSFDQWGLRAIKCPQAWCKIGRGDAGVCVAVIDTGLDYTHPDIANDGYEGPLEDRIWVNPKEDKDPRDPNWPVGDGMLGPEDLNGRPENGDWDIWVDDVYGAWLLPKDPTRHWMIDDSIGHGTMVAGIIGARSSEEAGPEAIGIAGVSKDCKIMTVKIESLDYDPRPFNPWNPTVKSNAAAQGLWYIVPWASIANCSWDYPIKLKAVASAIDRLWAHGGGKPALVVAAGNGGYDAAFTYPAADNRVIVVGASDPGNNVCALSNRGPRVDLVAPGCGAPEAMGKGILSLRAKSVLSPEYPHPVDGNYMWGAGTSYSAAFVSGACALYCGRAGSHFHLAELRAALSVSADGSIGTNPRGWDPDSGYGLLDAAALLDQFDQGEPISALIEEPAHRQVYWPSQKAGLRGLAYCGGPDDQFKHYSLMYGKGENPTEWLYVNQLEGEIPEVSNMRIVTEAARVSLSAFGRSSDANRRPLEQDHDIGVWDIDALPNGTYTLRLEVVSKSDRTYEHRITVKRFYGPPPLTEWAAEDPEETDPIERIGVNCRSTPDLTSHGALKVVDIDADGSAQEVIAVPGNQTFLQVFNADGSLRWYKQIVRGGFPFHGDIAVGDVDKTSKGCEIFACTWVGDLDTLGAKTLMLNYLTSDGNVVGDWTGGGWPKVFDGEFTPENGGPALADLDGDKKLDTVLLLSGRVPESSVAGELSAPTMLRAFLPDGSERFSREFTDLRLERYGPAFAVGDVRGDPLPEIVFGGLMSDGEIGVLHIVDSAGEVVRSVTIKGFQPKAIALADMNDDLVKGSLALEIAVLLISTVDERRHLWIIDGDGQPVTDAWRAPILLPVEDFYPDGGSLTTGSDRIVAVSLDGGGLPQLIVDGKNTLHVFGRDGKVRFERKGFNLCGVIAAGDVSGDGRPEIICNGLFGNTWGWDHAGEDIPGMPLPLNFRMGYTNPVIADLNRDGRNELVIMGLSLNGSKIWVYETKGSSRSASWPQEGGNAASTNSAMPVLRGDSNNDGTINVADAIYTLQWMFAQGSGLVAFASGDFNGDNQINLADPVGVLMYLFAQGPGPGAHERL